MCDPFISLLLAAWQPSCGNVDLTSGVALGTWGDAPRTRLIASVSRSAPRAPWESHLLENVLNYLDTPSLICFP